MDDWNSICKWTNIAKQYYFRKKKNIIINNKNCSNKCQVMDIYKMKNNLCCLLLVLEDFEKKIFFIRASYVHKKIKIWSKNFSSVIRDENFNTTGITNDTAYAAHGAVNSLLNNSTNFRRYVRTRRREISIA